jgi:hypothetical protein
VLINIIKNITVEPLFKNYKNITSTHRYKTLKLYLFFKVILQVGRNCHVLSDQISDPSAFLNSMRILKYLLNCEQHFSQFFIFRSGLARAHCMSYRAKAVEAAREQCSERCPWDMRQSQIVPCHPSACGSFTLATTFGRDYCSGTCSNRPDLLRLRTGRGIQGLFSRGPWIFLTCIWGHGCWFLRYLRDLINCLGDRKHRGDWPICTDMAPAGNVRRSRNPPTTHLANAKLRPGIQ